MQVCTVAAALRMANKMLNTLPGSKETAVLMGMVRLLRSSPKLTKRQLVSLMFFRAMDEERSTRRVYASLCKSLFTDSDQSLEEVVTDIMKRMMKLTELLPVGASPGLRATIYQKQMQCTMFWELLVSKVC
mmetsp:Transcript_133699/g.231914  ORF Transcript_133699/g.231914 Transcript_133699/m.231914 type:complete len:131 (-) Transcript_133699:573-965(-)